MLLCREERRPLSTVGLCESRKKIPFHEVVPNNFIKPGSRPCLIILVDLLNEVYSKEVCHVLTKDSNHRNISVILITQNLFHLGRYCRDISLSAKYLVPLKNVIDKIPCHHLARQVYPEDSGSLYEAYVNATAKFQVI